MTEIDRYDMINTELKTAVAMYQNRQFCLERTTAELHTQNENLRSINAELIEALEAIVKHQDMIGGTMAVFSGTRAIATAAIEKANLATNHPKD